MFLELIVAMPTKQPVITMIFPEELLKKVEDYRYNNRIPTRTEAIRQLLDAYSARFRPPIPGEAGH